MLCVPLLYSKNWSAEVNGKEADVLNINGGLIGVTLENGENKVEIRYEVPYFRIAVYISLVSLAVVLLLFIIPFPKKRREQN